MSYKAHAHKRVVDNVNRNSIPFACSAHNLFQSKWKYVYALLALAFHVEKKVFDSDAVWKRLLFTMEIAFSPLRNE